MSNTTGASIGPKVAISASNNGVGVEGVTELINNNNSSTTTTNLSTTMTSTISSSSSSSLSTTVLPTAVSAVNTSTTTTTTTTIGGPIVAGNGIVMIMPNGPNSFLPCLRKLRHLKSILCRNLLPVINRNAEISLPNTYYTLHAPPIEKHRSFLKSKQIETADEKIILLDGSDDEQGDINDDRPNIHGTQFSAEFIDSDDDESFDDDDKEEYYQDDNEDNDLPSPFYISEVVSNSYNPVWNPFDCYHPTSNDILDYHNTFNICIWHRSQCNNNNEIDDCDSEYQDELLFQTEIDLTQLEFIAQEMKQFVNLILPPNSIIFELKDGLYVTKKTKNQLRSTKANDYKFQSNVDKRKVITGNQSLFLCIIGKRLQNLKNIEVSKETSLNIENKLTSNQKYLDKVKHLENLKHRVEQLKQEYHNQLTLQDKDKESIETIKTQLIPKASALANAGIVYLQSYQMLEEMNQMLEMEKLLLNNIRSSLEKKKWYLLSQIRSIYPIQQGNKVLNINGLPLPNSDFNGFDEENISTALGYVCHILHLASRYLDIPLRYPMTPMASRSFIKDEISHHSSSKFPLYSKGVEKRIFDYAVFLLNKNLEQLLSSQGLGMFSLKETLPNVQILLGRSRIA
ncbi:hypothetical protein DFA_09795 [Cavenderia fasciculata]|uniref:UV radiation resistance-associated gene protein n=1 Tax=Cavenderia fasciculata TaxID=261658 RepID=F4Q8M3_CACFS|nr:uncharacterized protein DFA_09795 [Cavenderia fasciculata]EGG16123.1 hypothetical protein DFA_09795 [Cavenderia fasciculata]|eukprot:XP_004352460.1 hypothetical protein DFA_09795 [Cavenderia fasciculata]